MCGRLRNPQVSWEPRGHGEIEKEAEPDPPDKLRLIFGDRALQTEYQALDTIVEGKLFRNKLEH